MPRETRDPEGRSLLSVPGAGLCAISDIGLLRSANEDAFYVGAEADLLVVADGLGGLPAGEVASEMAVSTVVAVLRPGIDEGGGSGTRGIERLQRQAFAAAQHSLLAAGRDRPECRGMAATLIAAVITAQKLYTCHVGDVRGYVLRSSGLEQVTRDHSVVWDLVEAGILTPEQTRSHPERHLVTQALGLPENPTPACVTSPLRKGDSVLLCSDGLWEALAGEQIQAILEGRGNVCSRASRLVDAALAAGGDDNITVVLYEHCS